MAETFVRQLLAPKVILPLLFVAIVGIVLLTPVSDVGVPVQLTTYSASPGGARALYESADRLGWDVERRIEAFKEPLESSAVYAVLAPAIPLSSQEIGTLLSAVRAGAGLLYVTPPGEKNELADSLGLRLRPSRLSHLVYSVGIPASIEWGNQRCSRSLLDDNPFQGESSLSSLELRNPNFHDTVSLAAMSIRDSTRPVALSGTFGKGRVVVVSSPALLTNEFMRLCERNGGIVVLRVLEAASSDRPQRLIFDEFHHGFGTQPDLVRVMVRAMTQNTLGRSVLQIAIAALVLLFAAGARAVIPRPRKQIERRSPNEHVGALSRAYEEIGATRRSTQLLLRGLRRRRDARAWQRGSDEDFLRAIAARHPKVAADVDLVVTASKSSTTPTDFIRVGEAIDHIERTLSSDNS